MASLRKRYAPAVSAERSEAPVATTPTTAASPPPVAEAPKNIEQPTESSSPADVAASTAIRDRLREMQQAETMVQQQAAPRATEPRVAPPEQTAQAIPEPVQRWLDQHPQYLSDAVAQAELHVAATKTARDGKTWHDADFIPTVERYLGFSQQPPAQTKPAPSQVNGHAPVSAPTAPRTPTPVRQQQYNGGAASAPTSREVPSMASGRTVGRRVPLTAEELQVAQNSGISAEEYQTQKEKMARLRAAGAVQ
jgi:hypothetical protein